MLLVWFLLLLLDFYCSSETRSWCPQMVTSRLSPYKAIWGQISIINQNYLKGSCISRNYFYYKYFTFWFLLLNSLFPFFFTSTVDSIATMPSCDLHILFFSWAAPQGHISGCVKHACMLSSPARSAHQHFQLKYMHDDYGTSQRSCFLSCGTHASL